MEIVTVVAALIRKDGKFLIGRRSTGKYQGFWEFPGGKVKNNEEFEVALKREIHEELEITIKIERFVFKIEYTYPDFVLSMYCYLATTLAEKFALNDHSELSWFDPISKMEIDWLPADIKVIEMLQTINF